MNITFHVTVTDMPTDPSLVRSYVRTIDNALVNTFGTFPIVVVEPTDADLDPEDREVLTGMGD